MSLRDMLNRRYIKTATALSISLAMHIGIAAGLVHNRYFEQHEQLTAPVEVAVVHVPSEPDPIPQQPIELEIPAEIRPAARIIRNRLETRVEEVLEDTTYEEITDEEAVIEQDAVQNIDLSPEKIRNSLRREYLAGLAQQEETTEDRLTKMLSPEGLRIQPNSGGVLERQLKLIFDPDMILHPEKRKSRPGLCEDDGCVRKRLKQSGQNLTYQEGRFTAVIDADGEVSYDSDDAEVAVGPVGVGKLLVPGISGRTPGLSERLLVPKNRRNYRQKQRFLRATEEIRDKRYVAARKREMGEALIDLPQKLDDIWNDRSYSVREKKQLYFAMLDECDRTTKGGRIAMKVIAGYIRKRSQPSIDNTGGSE